jgi:Sap, sulfolipid-1-addressing protein
VGSLRGTDAVGSHDRVTKPAVDIAAGLISLGLAWLVWHGHTSRFDDWRAQRRTARELNPSWTTRALQRESALLAFGAGVLLNLPCLWYVAALTDIAAADISFAGELLWIVVFNLVMFTLVESSLVLYVADEARAQRLADVTSVWVRGHGREIVVSLAGAVGAWLVVKGVVAAV